MQVFQVSKAMQEIESISQSFPNALERCNWINADVKLKKLFLMFMNYLVNAEIKFSLYRVMDANFPTFLKV